MHATGSGGSSIVASGAIVMQLKLKKLKAARLRAVDEKLGVPCCSKQAQISHQASINKWRDYIVIISCIRLQCQLGIFWVGDVPRDIITEKKCKEKKRLKNTVVIM